MLQTNECLKILNQKEKKYTAEQAENIRMFLYQLGEIAYLQFKQIKINEESNLIYQGIYRRAS